MSETPEVPSSVPDDWVAVVFAGGPWHGKSVQLGKPLPPAWRVPRPVVVGGTLTYHRKTHYAAFRIAIEVYVCGETDPRDVHEALHRFLCPGREHHGCRAPEWHPAPGDAP